MVAQMVNEACLYKVTRGLLPIGEGDTGESHSGQRFPELFVEAQIKLHLYIEVGRQMRNHCQ